MNAFILALLILSSTLVTSACAKILGKDEREDLPREYMHLRRSVGLLVDTITGFRCTAFCVSHDTIVTNAHCLAWGVKKKYQNTRNLRDFLFRLDGQSTAMRWQNIKPIANPYLSALVNRPKKNWNASNYVDWAAVRLQIGVCGANSLKFANKHTINKIKRRGGISVAMIGYHSDRKRASISFQKCPLGGTHYRGGHAIAGHTCDTGSWSSGSPLFVNTPKDLRVVAIHRGAKNFKRKIRLALGSHRKQSFKSLNIAVLPIELNRLLPAYQDMAFIDKAVTLKAIQKGLRANGFPKTRTDGKVSTRLIWAIKRYQRRIGQAPTGIPTIKMLHRLKLAK